MMNTLGIKTQVKCPHCGALQKNSLFCKDCNKLLNIGYSARPKAQSQPKPKIPNRNMPTSGVFELINNVKNIFRGKPKRRY